MCNIFPLENRENNFSLGQAICFIGYNIEKLYMFKAYNIDMCNIDKLYMSMVVI